MTSKLVVNTIEADTGISSVSFASSISMNSTSKFHFSATGIDIGADTNINRPAAGVLGFNINSSEKARINSSGRLGLGTNNPDTTLTVQSGGDAQMSLKNSSGTTKAYVGTAGAFGSAGTDDLRIRSDSSNIVFGFTGAERLRIDSSGRLIVGGGTHAGGSALVVKGGGVNTYSTVGLFGATATPSNNAIFAQIRFGSGTTQVGATINAKADADWGSSNDYPTRLEFYTAPDGSGTVVERLRIDSSGRLLIGTTTEGAAAADNLTVSSSDNTGITIRSGTTHNGSIYFSDATSGIGEYAGQIDYDHNNNSLNFYADNDQCLRLLNDKSVSVSDKLVLENGTVFLNKHSVGVGTTTQAGRNAGVSTATGTIIYNAETEKIQVYANATWRNVGSLEPDQSSGYYSSLSAAQSAGLSHYWPGNSSTALISGLTPDDRKGNPTFNNKESNGYGATNPFFHFAGQTGGDSPTGYRYTHSADWVGHSFSICYWVKVMQEVTEGESTYVQLGNHSGTRSMFAMSSSGSTTLIGKTITIGDDNANDQIQYEFNNWIHVGVRYNYGANSATYYKNGVQTENHTFNNSLSVGTGSNHIYLGYGYWNGSTSNKESCSRMSDIGIWDSSSINGAIFGEIYRAGRIVKGY